MNLIASLRPFLGAGIRCLPPCTLGKGSGTKLEGYVAARGPQAVLLPSIQEDTSDINASIQRRH